MQHTQPVRVRVGVFEVDLSAGELRTISGGGLAARIVLPQQPFQVLSMLLQRAGQVVSREEIQKKLWPNDTVVEFEHSIHAAIAKLRKAFGDSANEPSYIETIAKRGYRLIAPTEWLTDSSGPSPTIIAPSDNGTAARSPAGGLIGKKVSHYRVAKVIGVGGMGLVYEAEDLKLGRLVALKFLPEDLACDPAALQRFEREARAASSLDHPNICTIYEVEEHEGEPFIVMQLLRGETLRDRLATLQAAQQRFSISELLDIALQVCEGLIAAHANGVIHRDIKPANIFLSTNGPVKILDFGVAKLMEAGEPAEKAMTAAASPDTTSWFDGYVTETGSTMGTAGYMSPEQVRGEKLDGRTDLFSFGLVLYEMATGTRAFSGETAAAVKDAIQNHEPVPVRECNPSLPPKLESIVNRALEKDRDKRYQSATEMRADLLALTEENNQSAGTRGHKDFPWKLVAAAVLVCVLMMTAGFLYWRAHRAHKLTDRDTIVIADFENKTGDLVFDETLKQGLVVELEQSPFLTMVTPQRVNETLQEMKRQPDERLTPTVAREICQRTGSRAMVTGAILTMGSGYSIELKAVDCGLGNTIAQSQAQARDKNTVLEALSSASLKLRSQLGESLASVQKYSTPLEEATTPSLEALKAYSLASKTRLTKGGPASLPLYNRAIELDPNFAMAYAATSFVYGKEDQRSFKAARTAYELRSRVSKRERFYIEGGYYLSTGELEKAAEVYEQWLEAYPRDFIPYANLTYATGLLGYYEKSVPKLLHAIQSGLTQWILYLNLASAYQSLNRLDQAELVYKEGEERKLGVDSLITVRYSLAFLKTDTAEMLHIAEDARGKRDIEETVLYMQADTEAWFGKVKSARELTSQALTLAQHNDGSGRGAAYRAEAGLREVECGTGNMLMPRQSLRLRRLRPTVCGQSRRSHSPGLAI
jgi:serine/threonine protein kinase/tetratricopeptide (TPR) repeat protein